MAPPPEPPAAPRSTIVPTTPRTGYRTGYRTAAPDPPAVPPTADPAPDTSRPSRPSVAPVLEVTAAGGEIKVRTPRYRVATFTSANKTYLTKHEYLKVELAFFGSKKVGGRRYPLIGKDRPTLTDEHGRQYILILYDDEGNRVMGPTEELTIPTSGGTSTTLVFTCPEDDAEVLTLELPTGGVYDEPVRFTIPVGVMDK